MNYTSFVTERNEALLSLDREKIERFAKKYGVTMPTLSELFNLCDYCVYAPCVCGNEPENCAAYVQRHGIELEERDDHEGVH